MGNTHKPQHMKSVDAPYAFNVKKAGRMVLTAGLTVALSAPFVLSPAAALAQGAQAEDARRDAMQQLADVQVRWSEATQKLIHAAEEAEKKNKVMTAEEAAAELAKVEGMRDGAADAAAAVGSAYDKAGFEHAKANAIYAEAARAKLAEQKKQAPPTATMGSRPTQP